MAEVAYVSEVHIERKEGPVRVAKLPGERQPVIFSIHGAIAAHYGRDPESLEPHAATLDYIVAATGGWMLGTFGGALEARKIDASNGRLTADVRGEIETEGGVLVIRRIHVSFRLSAPEEVRDVVQRVHSFFADKCPVYRSLKGAIEITSTYAITGQSATA